ncbi:MAG: hypothetical protein JXQ75_16050 [Phycisphaerae bacterium]|nr:hypothetical protein [Phycisphaerae bacterium]
MSEGVGKIKDWLPLTIAVCAVILAACYAVTRKSRAAEGIHEMNDLGATLSDAAEFARKSTLSQADVEKLVSLKEELEHRMADCLEPSLVQAELMKSAAEAGLVLREIRPIRPQGKPAAQEEAVDYPRYRVLVCGTYAQIATYMRLCTEQRLPARVLEFQLRRSTTEGGLDAQPGHGLQSAGLTADITVEAFRPLNRTKDDGDSD